MYKSQTCLLILLFTSSIKSQEVLNLNVLHMNDFHARFEETNDNGGTCKSDTCIGGLSRLYNVITNEIKENPDSILLNAGDNFQGTLWYSMFKWNVTQYFLNKLPFDAIVLGNHEFDDGIDGVVPFIKSLKAPIIVSNINDTLEPNIQNTYTKSVVIERNGKKIGIIGVIIRTVTQIANTEKLTFLDESESVNREAERLVKEENVFTNIVLSHCGYTIEQEIARKATKASKIGLIVGGHSHTFLYSQRPIPGPLEPAGQYPTVVNRAEDDKVVLVVQAACYCRYLGNINVGFDENGSPISWSKQPIFLDTIIEQDTNLNAQLQPWKEAIDAQGNVVLGSTLVTLDQSNCKYAECLLGNFITDVMVYNYIAQADQNSWTYASIAIMHSGGIRTTIEKGTITYNDIINAQPFGDTWDVGEIQGKFIKEALEYCMTPYDYGREYSHINLLQVSGIRVVANLSQPMGSRIQSIKVLCNECRVPTYEDLNLEKTYRLIVPSFLELGGDNYVMLSNNLKNIQEGPIDVDGFAKYLKENSPVFEEIDGRITIIDNQQVVYKNLHD